MWRLSSYSLKPELSHTLRALPARLDEDGLASPFHHPPSTSILWLGVTQPREQAREEAGQAHLHPHLGFLARGQWQPVSHLKEVPGPKQEVALLVEPSSPNRSSPGQVLMKTLPRQTLMKEGKLTGTKRHLFRSYLKLKCNTHCLHWETRVRELLCCVILGTPLCLSEVQFPHLEDHYGSPRRPVWPDILQ